MEQLFEGGAGNIQAFNHDAQARRYDTVVQNEAHPIRTGYAEALRQVAKTVSERKSKRVADLGAGTGNLAVQTTVDFIELVDISAKMLAVAEQKMLATARSFRIAHTDIASYVNAATGTRSFISSYALHHLPDAEKVLLLQKMFGLLGDGDVICIADLMFESPGAREEVLRKFEAGGNSQIRLDTEEEFFWDIAAIDRALGAIGMKPVWERVSELSWILTINPGR